MVLSGVEFCTCGHRDIAHDVNGCLADATGHGVFCECKVFVSETIKCKTCDHSVYFHYKNFCVCDIEDDHKCVCTEFVKK